MKQRLALVLLTSTLAGCLVGSELDASETGPTGTGGTDDVRPDDDGDGLPDDGDTVLLPPGKIAVVLAHGFSGSEDSFDPAIVAAIQAQGHVVKRATVPGIESVAVRAAALAPQIDQLLAATGAAKVHVIAHSMGGLDARHLISTMGYAPKVASLTTISTPHRGTPLADLALGLVTNENVTREEALDAIVELVGNVDLQALNRALLDLSESRAATFNAATPDAAGVKYLSYAGLATPAGIDQPNAPGVCGPTMPEPASTRAALLLAQPIVARGDDRVPNDGVVSVASGTWGTFQGCIAADHLDETSGPAEDEFDTATFYRDLANKLALL